MGKVTQQYELLIGARQLASWNRSIRGASSSISRLGNIATSVARSMTAAFSFNAIKQFATDAADTYKEFEQEMKNTAAIAGATASQYATMEEAAREAGRTTTITAGDSAAALGYMSLAGWDAEQSVKGLLPILKLAESTGKDLQTTSDLVTDSMSALGLSVDDLDEYLDKLIMTNNSANTSAEQLMYSLVKTGGSAKVLGVDMDDLITATGVLANNGLKSSEAGTALNSILKRLGSNSQAKKALDGLGISLYDAENRFIGFKELFTQINEAMPTNADDRNSIMSMLGGRFFSQVQYLLDSVSDATKGNASTWDSLIGKVESADGALDRMNQTATSSLSAAQKLLESAWADFQIEAVDVFSEDAKETMYYIAGELPRLAELLSEFEEEHHDEIKRFLKDAREGVVKLAEGAIRLGDWIMDNGPEVQGIISGLIAMQLGGKVVTLAAGFAEAYKTAGSFIGVLTGGPWGLAIAGFGAAVTAISALNAEAKKAREEAIDESLAEHFGAISLSAQEIEEATEKIFGTKNYARLEAVNEQLEQSKKLTSQIEEYGREIDKLNWKVEAGIKLKGADKTAYKEDIKSLISDAQEELTSRQYTFALDVSFLSGGKDASFASSMNDFYNSQNKELKKAGKKLQKAVNSAWEDGLLEVDEEKEIQKLLEEFNRIQTGIEEAQMQGKLEAINMRYAGAAMDPETYEKYLGELSEHQKEMDKA
ncbi:MAG: phage tail tape measure protein, partial [Lachnospiraceae bacterium]|nr:phage tail tape measure protein [Lachnospiraceae bacterium]